MTTTVETIHPLQLEELRKSGKPIDLIDVRTPAEYQDVRVAYARSVPLDRLNPQAIVNGRNGSCDHPLFIICRSGARGKQACEKFIAAGYCNVINVDGGTLACEAAGLPLVRGQKTISLERQVRTVIGLVTLAGAALAWFVDPIFLALPAFSGAGLIYAGITDRCPLALAIAKLPWNQGRQENSCCAT